MYWSAGALVALLCGDTVTLSNEDKFPERDNKVYKKNTHMALPRINLPLMGKWSYLLSY